MTREAGATMLRDRISGALLGVHAGDALGATREFGTADPKRRHSDIVGGGPFRWEPGEPTDDTAQTAIVLRAYRGRFTLERVADGLLRWFDAGPKDVGAATSEALRRYARTGDPRCSGAGAGQRGNGSLMRCIPTALVGTSPLRRAQESRHISAITHDDVICCEACVTYNMLAAALVDGAESGQALRWALAACQHDEVREAVQLGTGLDLEAAGDAGDPGVPYGNHGYVLDSLSLAVAALVDGRPFEDILVDVVSLGGDADTTAAVAGGLVGARDGAGGIPRRWLERLWLRHEFERAPEWLLPLREANDR